MVQVYLNDFLEMILKEIRNSEYPLAKLSTVTQKFLIEYILGKEKLLRKIFKEKYDEITKKLKEEIK